MGEDEGKVAYFHVHAKREKVYYFCHIHDPREKVRDDEFSLLETFSRCVVCVQDASKLVLQFHVPRQQVQFLIFVCPHFRCHLQLVSIVFVSE